MTKKVQLLTVVEINFTHDTYSISFDDLNVRFNKQALSLTHISSNHIGINTKIRSPAPDFLFTFEELITITTK